MSSTNRSNVRDSHVSDYYVTPIKSINEFLENFQKIESVNKGIKILDCCAGGDVLHLMSYPEALKSNEFIDVTTIDIREDSLASIKRNYLETDCKNIYDMIITNPPFNMSLDIINKALYDVKDNGFVIMLLRLNYFGSDLRKKLWETHMPKYCFVHHKRMSFTDNGKTDSIEYCHMVWQKGFNPDFAMLKVL
jgi:16S RNA G1207 methylase RsmC